MLKLEPTELEYDVVSLEAGNLRVVDIVHIGMNIVLTLIQPEEKSISTGLSTSLKAGLHLPEGFDLAA